MPPDTAQRLSTLIRLGIIAEVDYAAERVRVKTGDNLTDWVRWRTERCGLVKVWNPPQLGEEVELIAPDGDMTLAYVGGSFANSDNPFPSHDGNLVVVTYSDGTRIEHNRSTGEQTISGLKTLTKNITTTRNNSDTHNTGAHTSNGKNTSDSHTHKGVSPGASTTDVVA